MGIIHIYKVFDFKSNVSTSKLLIYLILLLHKKVQRWNLMLLIIFLQFTFANAERKA